MSPPGRRAVVAALAVLAGLLGVNAALGTATPAPHGPAGSSYATSPRGAAALLSLIAGRAHPVLQLRGRELRPAGATVFLLSGPSLAAGDAGRLRRFVRGGGHLVAAGGDPRRTLRGVLPAGTFGEWRSRGPARSGPLAPQAENAGVAQIAGSGAGSFAPGGSALPLLGAPGAVTAAVARLGRGRVSVLADAGPLQNRWLGAADNARLAVALAGPAGSPVAFAESVHGYGGASGLSAVPVRWRWSLAGLALAGLLWLLAQARRLGPPVAERDALVPPRREYVDALAATLARTRDPGAAAAPVRAAALRALDRGLPPGDGGRGAERRRAAAAAGLDARETAALVDGIRSEDDALAAGRALATLAARGGRR